MVNPPEDKLVRLWDKDFNLVYEWVGNPGRLFTDMHVTVDSPPGTDWRSRRTGRITSWGLRWLTQGSLIVHTEVQENKP